VPGTSSAKTRFALLAGHDDLCRDQPMLDHVSITVSDIPAAERFCDAIMKVLGVVGECRVIPV
jgi:hypothetical protein